MPGPAEVAYRDPLSLDSSYTPAYLNLADILRSTGRDAEGGAVLRRGLEFAPDDAHRHHALGLLLVRSGDAGAVEQLRIAVDLALEVPRYASVLAVALNSAGDQVAALDALETVSSGHPWEPEILSFLALLARDRGDLATAIGYAERATVCTAPPTCDDRR